MGTRKITEGLALDPKWKDRVMAGSFGAEVQGL